MDDINWHFESVIAIADLSVRRVSLHRNKTYVSVTLIAYFQAFDKLIRVASRNIGAD